MKEPLASRLLFPVTEGAFTYRRYDDWLARLAGWNVVPLRELAATATPALGLRHDVDDRLGSALELARLEHARGIRATYFVLHTASYYTDANFLDVLSGLQDELGHEIGWHNDLGTLQLVYGVDAATYLHDELNRLRAAGIDIVGTAAHGSPHCHRLGYHNNYVFNGWDEPQAGFPLTDVGVKLDPGAFGLEYEAYHVPYDRYSSDSRFDGKRRRHPDEFHLDGAQRAIVLVHPCHWDRSRAAKTLRLARRVQAKLRDGSSTSANRSASVSAL